MQHFQDTFGTCKWSFVSTISIYLIFDPVHSYEKFANKKWAENANNFATRKKFIKATNNEWKSVSDGQVISYKDSNPENKNNKKILQAYFRAVPKETAQTETTVSLLRYSSAIEDSATAIAQPLPNEACVICDEVS